MIDILVTTKFTQKSSIIGQTYYMLKVDPSATS